MSREKKYFNEKRYASHCLCGGEKERIGKIVSLVGKGKLVLDVGCGLGQIGRALIKNHNQVYGVDISPSAVKKAQKKGLIAQTLDIETKEIPYPNNFFETIVAAEIIEHLWDTDRFLKRLSRKLKKGGDLIITTPNLATFGRRLLLLLGKNPLIETRVTTKSAGHIRYFVRNSLIELVEKNGFKVVNITSDLVNFSANGRYYSARLAQILPSLGRSLIIKAVKA